MTLDYKSASNIKLVIFLMTISDQQNVKNNNPSLL